MGWVIPQAVPVYTCAPRASSESKFLVSCLRPQRKRRRDKCESLPCSLAAPCPWVILGKELSREQVVVCSLPELTSSTRSACPSFSGRMWSMCAMGRQLSVLQMNSTCSKPTPHAQSVTRLPSPCGRLEALRAERCCSAPSSARVFSDEKGCEPEREDFGREIAHEAVSRRPPISLLRSVARAEGNTYATNVWDWPSFKGHFLSPYAKPWRYDSQLVHRL
jgi:hypothetical protein